ncbi:hypothetical protein FHX81_4397 [Saccharothrix saharensis]|uniref:Uncharacterized protein n=1 Tax=Saccharothrix saharensis TaxID=571190 RepID=A0A543JGN4_9PSEU|nr:hypothetical protein [Saccharothrix saharensis]TQM82005.1 hypothetical protein FHX81_4397 [Saccharothrix saharensis]
MSCVDQRAGTGASRVRRLLSRALLVVGGTLAGTAAAWALSTAPASAQVPVDQVAEVAHDALSPDAAPSRVETALAPVRASEVGRAVQELDTALRTPRVPEPSPPRLRQVAEDIRGAVGGVRDWLRHPASVQAPADVVVGGVVTRDATETTPAATAVPVSAGTPVVHGVFAKLSRTWLDAPRRPVVAPPGDNGSSLPGDPSGLPSMPFAPLGAPVHCSCGGDGSGSSSGGNGPFSVVSADHIDAAVARALFPATERNVVMPGKQPGITPD